MLRPWRAADVPAAARAARDPAIRRYSHLPEPFDRSAVTAWVEGMAAERAAGRALRLVIGDAQRPELLLGAIALFDLRRDRAEGEIGYWLAPGARGRGLAGRAVGLLAGWALARHGLERVLATVDPDNDPSRRVLAGCGFRETGIRDGKLLLCLEPYR